MSGPSASDLRGRDGPESPGRVSFGFFTRELSICTLLSHLSRPILSRTLHERPSPDHSRSAVSGHASYSSRASGTITFSDSCMSIGSHFAFAYRVAYPACSRDACRSPGSPVIFRIVPPANTLVRWVNEKRLRPHSAGSTLPHLWPTCSSSGWPPLTTARYFSSCPSDSRSLWTPCPPVLEQPAPGPPWLCPAFAFVPV